MVVNTVKHGERGEQGPPGVTPASVSKLTETVERLRSESEIQLVRIAQLQAQLDVALSELHLLQKKPA
jgi:hypothetical protein